MKRSRICPDCGFHLNSFDGLASCCLVLLAMAALVGCGSSGSGSSSGKKSYEVGSEGGTIDYSNPDNADVTVEMVIPAGSVPDGTTITIQPADSSDYPDSDDLLADTAFEFGPAGLEFDPAATLTVHYDESQLGSLKESKLRLHKVVSGEWSEIDSTVDTDADEVSGEISSFSFWGILRRIFGGGSGSTVSSYVDSVEPEDGETGVDPFAICDPGDVNGRVRAFFDRDMDGDTFTSTSVLLYKDPDGENSQVTGLTLTYDSDDRSLLLSKFGHTLSNSTKYEVTITTDVETSDGTAMPVAESWTWTTGITGGVCEE